MQKVEADCKAGKEPRAEMLAHGKKVEQIDSITYIHDQVISTGSTA